MAIQFSVGVRNARLDTVESTIGVSPVLELWSGTKPANCAGADAGDGDLLCAIQLPSDWMDAADSGSKPKLGTWSGTGTVDAGVGTTCTHFRLKEGSPAECHIQGTVDTAAADLILDNTSIAEDQVVTINTFTLTDGNA
jgi:hypothetical protein